MPDLCQTNAATSGNASQDTELICTAAGTVWTEAGLHGYAGLAYGGTQQSGPRQEIGGHTPEDFCKVKFAALPMRSDHAPRNFRP